MPEKVAHVNSLAQLLEQHGFIPEPQVSWMFVYVLRDLELHHSQGELHLDIKPSNMVRGTGGTFKLTRYGKSRIGTARYMAPERAMHRAPSARSDVYSLGVVLFEAATGRLPFASDLNYELLEAHINERPPVPQSIRPEVSSELQRIILTALAKDPNDRFQSAKEFGEALAQLAEFQTAAGGKSEEGAGPEPAGAVAGAEPTGRRRRPAAAGARTAGRARVPVLAWAAPPVVIVAAVVLAFALRPWARKMPNLVGMSQAEAGELAVKAGFALAVEGEKDDTARAGTVVSQSPRPGTRLGRADSARVWLSSGVVVVPEVAGMAFDEARVALERLGLLVSRVDSAYSDDQSINRAVGTDPPVRARAKPGTTVSLVLAMGRATCPECGLRRERGARFCTRCGSRFEL